MQLKAPHPANNPISLLGGVLAVVAFGGLVFFLGIQILDVAASPYIGMLIYLGLPAALVIGNSRVMDTSFTCVNAPRCVAGVQGGCISESPAFSARCASR